MKPGEARRIEDVIHDIETEGRASDERLRKMMKDMGRDDVLAEYDQNMRDLRTGVSGARNCWHSISERQRSVLILLSRGYKLRRRPGKTTLYDAHGTERVIMAICRIKTLRALCGHELAHVNGGAVDPEAEFLVTERGKFVVRHGKGKE